MSSDVTGPPQPSGSVLACARDADGRFITTESEHPTTPRKREAKKRLRTERDYMRRIVTDFSEDDIGAIIAAIKHDAVGGEDVDVKVINAARDWVGKHLLGNARVPLEDVENQPAIVKRR